VLVDREGREIHVHVIVLDEKGNGIYGPREKGEMYLARSLTGTGKIEGQPVRCISAEWSVRFHSGYGLTKKDFQDAAALCDEFGIELPAEHRPFNQGSRKSR